MPVETGAERIGLLFVHGIGEQKRWDHLKSSVQEFAELLLQTGQKTSVIVVDRTNDWPHPAGQPDPQGLAPITMLFTDESRKIEFECFEVWWADLGSRAGAIDAVTFWLWGLGQWAAPIYRELDASALPKEKPTHLDKPVSMDATLPESVAGSIRAEPPSRLQLVLAALAALFVAITWTLAKRLFAAILGKAPPPTLIVRYVGDVRTYESRAAPGACALSDPARPRRVGIRRRMVREMVALGTAKLDGWYVLAHSLGTVVAYNGLTETGHALPNYLTEDQWNRVPPEFKRDDDCRRRTDLTAMMPGRPPWLQPEDVINRKLLFGKLRGFLTYGSPLDKFAALWPRIVATATDRRDDSCPFPNACRWINLAAPSDPVAGALDSYGRKAAPRLRDAIPKVENYRTPWNISYGLSHIQYFTGVERFSKARSAEQKRQVAKWLLDNSTEIGDYRQPAFVRVFTEKLAYPVLVALLWFITTALAVAALIGVEELGWADIFDPAKEFTTIWWGALEPVLALALFVILGMGLLRWWREARLNVALAQFDKEKDPDQSSERQNFWKRIIWMERSQWVAASIVSFLTLLGLLLALAWEWGAPTNWLAMIEGEWAAIQSGGGERSWWGLGAIAGGLGVAVMFQTLLNKIVPPVGQAPG